MNDDEQVYEIEAGEVLFRRRFRMVLEFDAEFHDMKVHPEDTAAIHELQNLLLADEEALSKFLFCRCIDHLDFDLPRVLMKAGFHEAAGSEIVDSKARLLPLEAVTHLLDLEIAGLGFADELKGEAVNTSISKISVNDLSSGKEMIMEPLEPFFYIQNYERCYLGKTEAGWAAVLTVRLNHTDEKDNREAIEKALHSIDEIHRHVADAGLPVLYASVGILAPSEEVNNLVRTLLQQRFTEQLPGVKAKFWFRKEKPIRSISFKELLRRSQTDDWGDLTAGK